MVAGPFTFNLVVPYVPGRANTPHRAATAGGSTVTLERIVLSATQTRIYLTGAGPDAVVSLIVAGRALTLRPPGAYPCQWSADHTFWYTSTDNLLNEHGERTVVVKPAPVRTDGTSPACTHARGASWEFRVAAT